MNFKSRERKQWRGISNVTSWLFSPAANNYETYQIDMSLAEFSKLGLPESEAVSINTTLRDVSFDYQIKTITGSHLASCLMDTTPNIKMAAHLQLGRGVKSVFSATRCTCIIWVLHAEILYNIPVKSAAKITCSGSITTVLFCPPLNILNWNLSAQRIWVLLLFPEWTRRIWCRIVYFG
jgi:hypothetical protein